MNKPKSKKAIETKHKLILSAKKLFSEKDINKTSVREIVEEAGVAKGTFYLYFETKEDVVWAIINDCFNDLTSVVKSIQYEPVAEETIDKLVDQMTNGLNQYSDILKMSHHIRFQSYIGSEKYRVEFEKEIILSIKKWLDRGVEKGNMKIENTYFYAVFIYTSTHEIIDRVILGTYNYSFNEMSVHLKSILKKVIF